MKNLKELYEKEEFQSIINELSKKVKKSTSIFTNPDVKEWCGKRFRNLFITEALKDPVAMKAASSAGFLSNKDERPDRQKIAERFLRGDGPREWNLEMPEAGSNNISNTTLVFCPGMLNGLLPVRAFQEAFPAIHKKYGWNIIRADLHPMRGCDANCSDLEKALYLGLGLAPDCTEIDPGNASEPKSVIIIAYSKGMPDLLTLLVKRPELKNKIKCIFNLAGACGGSFLANDIYNSLIKIEANAMEEKINDILTLISPVVNLKGPLKRHDELDIVGCLRDLTTEVREAFWKENSSKIEKLNIPIFNISAATTLTEVPLFQIQGTMSLNKYDSNNDMQLTQSQARLNNPISTDLAMLHGHHWDISFSQFPKLMRLGSPNLDHPFPKEAAAVAIFKFAAELGLID